MKTFILFLLLLSASGAVSAQTTELPKESTGQGELSGIKDFGGFLLDMGQMNLETPALPAARLEIPHASNDYSRLFGLPTDAVYSQGFTHALSPSLRYSGFYGSAQYMQTGSFRLKNGMHLQTYGDYNQEGWRMPDHSALPWERNRFRGAFELKSGNGNFGLRIEVQQGGRGLR